MKKDTKNSIMKTVEQMPKPRRVMGRAYTKEEKRIIIEKLYNVWSQLGDIRLGQLIKNATEDMELFYLEDDELAQALEDYVAGSKIN